MSMSDEYSMSEHQISGQKQIEKHVTDYWELAEDKKEEPKHKPKLKDFLTQVNPGQEIIHVAHNPHKKQQKSIKKKNTK